MMTASGEETSASELIDARIAELGDWRGETLARVRALIRDADPEVVEAVKWRKPSNPAGSHARNDEQAIERPFSGADVLREGVERLFLVKIWIGRVWNGCFAWKWRSGPCRAPLSRAKDDQQALERLFSGAEVLRDGLGGLFCVKISIWIVWNEFFW